MAGVHWEVAGSGPAVVLSHDGALHSEAWDAQFGAWPASGYRVARWDRRGYGRSPRAAGAFSSVDDLVGLLGAVGAPAVLVGCSFGGLVSLQCALDHPELVASLVLVGPIVSGLPLSEHFNARGGRGVPGPGASAEEQIEYISERDPWFIAPANLAARARLRELLLANPQNLNSGIELERIPEVPALARLGEIKVPTLIVVGEQDIADVHAHSGAIEAGVSGAKRVVIPGSGHLPHLEVPEAFNPIVLEFLAERT